MALEFSDVEVKDYQFKGELDKDNDKQFIRALELLKEIVIKIMICNLKNYMY